MYVNYRPKELLTRKKISYAFKELISSEEDPDKVTKSRFLTILASGGKELKFSSLKFLKKIIIIYIFSF